jgi:hypothetical protein
MPYCRKCGAQLDEDARFCRVCGTAAEPIAHPIPPPYHNEHRNRPIAWPIVGALIAVLVVAVVVAGLVFVPFQNVNYQSPNVVPTSPDVNSLYLSLDANVADINIVTTSAPGELVRVDVSATGSIGLFGSPSEPVNVAFTSFSENGTETVTCKVTLKEVLSLNYGLNVKCNIYLDPSVAMNVQVSTKVGTVKLNSAQTVTFKALSLHSTTGTVETSFSGNVLFEGPVSVSTTTGSVQFNWANCRLSANTPINIHTTTGSIHASITQTTALGANATLNVGTTTGSVNFDITLAQANAAYITSHSSTGHISVDVHNFNGNQSPIYSNNYPAANNFLTDLATTTGSVNVVASYQGVPSGNPF